MAPLSAAVTCQVQGSHFGHKSLLR
jgi:hypothetical protein